MGKRLPVYQSAVTLFFLFVSFGGNYWQQGGADWVCFVADDTCMGLFCLSAKEKSDRMVLPPLF